MLIALDADSGKKKWSLQIGELLTNGWGDGPRMSPTIANGKIYALGGKGNLVCADTGRGKLIWKKSMVDDLAGKVPGWGYTESVLVDQGKVICTPGGNSGTLAALDANTGKTVWRSKDFTDGAQYSSPIAVNHEGQRQYIQLVMKNLVGIDSHDGSLLWKSSWPGKVAVIPTPIYSDGHAYITSGYGVGCKLVRIGKNAPQNIYENKVMKNHHGGVIKIKDYLYGYSDGVGWVCQNFKTGEMMWNEKKALGKGAIAYADGRLYCQGEGDGRIIMIEAFGKLFKDNVKIYAYPIELKNFERYRKQMGIGDNVETVMDENKDGLVTINNLLVAGNLRNLYKYIRENGFLVTIENCDRNNMNLFSRDIFELVCNRTEGWKENLPKCVSEMIESKNLWKVS